MTEKSLLTDDTIVNMIYHIRGQKVMLDTDLAVLYSVETRALKQSVRRNLKRFPDDFMFQLTESEWKELITNCDNLTPTARFSPALPFAFTEQGVAMLSSVLKSDRAININIQIMRIFTKVRQMLTNYTELRVEIEKIKNKLHNQDKNMEIVFQCLDELSDRIPLEPEPAPRKRIGFKQDEE